MDWLRKRLTNMAQGTQFAIGGIIVWLLAAVILFGLYGCATFDTPAESFDWYRERAPAKIKYTVIYIAPELVAGACDGARACTIHSQRIIFLPEGAPAWYLDHELRHQNGENHS